MTILLCGRPGSSAGHLVAEPVRLAPDGVWLAAVSPRRWWALTPPFHPYLRRLARSVAGGLLSVPLSVGFRRLGFPQRPALWCPDFPRAAYGPRSPGLQAGLYPRLGVPGRRAQARSALRTRDRAARVEDELAADEALEADAAEEREQLLVERPVQRHRLRHCRLRKTPTTLPRICAYSGYIGSSSSFSGWRRMRPSSRKKVLTVASSAVSSSPASAATMSPFRTSCWRRNTTKSPSSIPAPIMESPFTRRRNSSPPRASGSGTAR